MTKLRSTRLASHIRGHLGAFMAVLLAHEAAALTWAGIAQTPTAIHTAQGATWLIASLLWAIAMVGVSPEAPPAPSWFQRQRRAIDTSRGGHLRAER